MARTQIPLLRNAEYLRKLAQIDTAFSALEDAPHTHACRKGCDHCCSGPFDVSVGDLWVLVEGVASLDDATRARVLHEIRRAAEAQRAQLPPNAKPTVEAVGDDAFDSMCDALEAQPCPFLVDHACAVYTHRPESCRWRGAVVETPDGAVDLGCPIGLNDGAAAVRFDLEPWHDAAAALERGLEAPEIEDGRTTIAIGLDAILRSLREKPRR